MNLDAEAIALSQIQYLVTSLTKKNYKSHFSECLSVVDRFGAEADRHLLRCLVSQIDFSQPVKTNSPHVQFLAQYFELLFAKSNFSSVLCSALENPLTYPVFLKPSLTEFENIIKAGRLSPIRALAFALALSHSVKAEFQKLSQKIFEDNLNLLLQSLSSSESSKHCILELDKGCSLIHLVLSELAFSSHFTTLIADLKDAFSHDKAPDFLLPFFELDKEKKACDFGVPYSEEAPSGALSSLHVFCELTDQVSDIEKDLSFCEQDMTMPKLHLDTALPELVREFGYSFTSNTDTCRMQMRQLIGGNSEVLSATVARIIGVMLRTHTGLDDSATLQSMNATGTSLWEKEKQVEPKTWNLEVFIKVIHELQPAINWKEIIYELDHPGFAIKDRQGLILLIKALKLGFQAQGFSGSFPIEMFYRPWKNSDGQVTLFQQILRNPEVFNFCDHAYHSVAIDVLKVSPDLENRDLAAWRSLEVIDTLLLLAEGGHTHAIKEIFSVPQIHCPDVLTLGLMQINPPMTNFRAELLVQNLQIFLNNHPNSGVILTHAWHSTTINLKGHLIHAMGEWYSKAVQEGDSEHTRLSRILDVAQDLKALSVLLSASSKLGVFVIDLAVLASRREYLNLDKWLTDQIRENGEQFVKTVVNYLQRKLPNIHGPGPLKDEHLNKVNFPIESFTIILICLHQLANTAPIQADLKEHILNMYQNSQALLNRPRLSQQPQQQPQPQQQAASMQAVLRATGAITPTPVAAGAVRGLASRSFSHTDPIVNLSSQLSHNLNLTTGSSTGLPNIASGLGPLVSGTSGTPSSPIRTYGGAMDGSGASSPFNPLIAAASASSGPLQGNLDHIKAGIPNVSNLFPEINGSIAREVEEEANSYFQRIYNHPPHPTLTIDEVLDLLKKFQDSGIQRERDVFNCMIKNLFEEYKYFPQYPEKELHITAKLFGGIIEHGLVNMIPLGLALRLVRDAVRQSVDSKMYFFGIAALDRFKTRLKDYPQYCQHLTSIAHFKDFPPYLVEWIECGVQSQVPTSKAQTQPHLLAWDQIAVKGPTTQPQLMVTKTTTTVTTVSSVSTSSAIVRPIAATVGGRPSIANTTNIDTLINARLKSGLEPVRSPSDKMQDKVAFIFNNLSIMNMQQKADDLKETLASEASADDDNYNCWLAQYLVMKRASIEPNFHTLYASFLEVLQNEKLYKEVLKETFSNIRILLLSDKNAANFSDRSLLKNLGHWLGLMTLARNRPILLVDLDLKPLIIEAHQLGQQELLYVVPFVAKVLESCAKSKVFKPPSPWTMGIMNLLAELHQEHDLKLNLKFEIEVLCKALSLELAILQPGNLLGQMISIRNFGLKSQTPPTTSQMGSGVSHKSMVDPFNVMHANNSVVLRKLEHLGASHASVNVMEHAMHLPGNSNMTSFAASGGAGSTPGSGLGGALMQAPTAQVSQSGFMLAANSQFSQHEASSAQQPNASIGALDMAASQLATGAGLRPVEPKFHFTDINTSNLNGIAPHIVVDNRLNLIKEQPDFIQLIKISIEKSIQEVAPPVIDRAIKIALTTCEQLIKKDFALDHDENRVRQASHHMVRNLTAAMVMITCRDHLSMSIKNYLKNYMGTLGRNLTQLQSEAIEFTALHVANDNVELACAFIQKKAIDKAIVEIDKRFKGDYEARMLARKESRPFCDAVTLTYQAERMPEPIRLKMGGVSQQQHAVYEEFARNIPGFKPLSEREVSAIMPKIINTEIAASLPSEISSNGSTARPSQAPVASEECIAILEEVHLKLEPFVQGCTTLPTSPHMANLHSLLETLNLVISTKDIGSVNLLIQKAVMSLLEGLTPHLQVDSESLARYRDANLLVLRALSDTRAMGSTFTNARITGFLTESRDECKYNLDAVDALIRSGLVSLHDYDKHLAQAICSGENTMAITFAMHLCKIYLIDDRSNANIIESDLFTTIEALQRISTQSHRLPEGITNLMELIKMSSERLEQNLALTGPTAQLHSGIAQARELEDPPGLVEKTEYLLREWVNAYHSRDAGKDSRQAFVVFVQLMNQHGILKTDDLITRFFRMSTQMCVDLCYRALTEQTNSPTLVRAKCFHTLDAYVRLITLLVKHSGETQNTITKVNLLNKVLGIVAGVLLIDHDVRSFGFQQVPYHRIFIMLFLELNSPDPILENINFQVLTAYCNMLHILRPIKAPGFAFSWLEIVSHRVFLGRILAQTQGQKGWSMFAQLLIDLFTFLSPFLRNAELTKPVHRLYRGTLRVLLVLLHDFPEFLCDYHYGFCDVIPPNCIQMRNLILSAFPRNMRLPDPFTPNLKVETLPDISIAPKTVSNYAALIKPSFKKDLDSYLKNRSPVAFLSELRCNLLVSSTSGVLESSPGNRYNIQLINALVMYVGTSAIQHIRAKGLQPGMSTIAHSSHMDIFQNLAVDLETEGRYLFLNCIANQLRYPNSHTHYFSCTLLYLFAEANQEAIQEQITRVLLERLIVNRPHPWGLLITFIELIKNSAYSFWNHDFVHCAPEIQKLFESVAKSCMVVASVPRMDVDMNVD